MQNQQRVLSLIVASSGHHTQFTFQNHPCLGSRWPPLGIYTIYIYSVYIRYFWQGNHQIYGHIRSIYTVLANLKHISVTAFRSIGTLYYLRIPFTTCAWLFTSCPYPLLPAHTLYYLRIPFTTCAWPFITCAYPLLPAHTLYLLRIPFTTCAYPLLLAHTLYYLRIPFTACAYPLLPAHGPLPPAHTDFLLRAIKIWVLFVTITLFSAYFSSIMTKYESLLLLLRG
jgi:hypothetical protein